MELIQRSFEFPSLRSFVEDYIATCMRCARNKSRRHRPHGFLQPLPVPDRPWSSISMDFIEQLPTSKDYDAILVVVDRLSKMAHFLACTGHTTSKDLADMMLRFIFSQHGYPSDIVSDRGSKFISRFWQTVTSKLQIKRKLSTAYHPQTDGQTERVNQSLEQYLRIYCAYQQDDSYDWLSLAEVSYNNAQHSSTGISPFYANYGFHPSFDTIDGVSTSVPGRHYVSKLDEVHTQLRRSLEASIDAQRTSADLRRKQEPDIKVGDYVLLSTQNFRTTRPTRKLAERYAGPFKVIEQVSKLAFRLELPPDLSKIHPVFHVTLLEPTRSSSIPGRRSEPPPPLVLEGEELYDVKQIVDARLRKKGKKLEYQIEWLGYEDSPDRYTWEPASNFTD